MTAQAVSSHKSSCLGLLHVIVALVLYCLSKELVFVPVASIAATMAGAHRDCILVASNSQHLVSRCQAVSADLPILIHDRWIDKQF